MPPVNKATTTRRPQDHKPKADSKPDVALDLDTIEREGKRPKPFTFNHCGEVFTLGDPAEIELSDIVVASNDGDMANVTILVRLLGDDYQRLVKAGPLPNWKIPILIQAWEEHYDTDLGKVNDSSP